MTIGVTCGKKVFLIGPITSTRDGQAFITEIETIPAQSGGRDIHRVRNTHRYHGFLGSWVSIVEAHPTTDPVIQPRLGGNPPSHSAATGV